MRILFSILLLVLAGLRPVLPWAADSAAALFERGVDSFRAGQYERALADFEAAESAGLNSAQLIYNFGSVHYRLGNYATSRTYFEWLTDHPELAGLAWYNLALIAHRLDDDARARELFRHAADSAAEPGIRRLAERQLAKLEALAAPEKASAPAFELTGLLGLDLGWDSNIELDSSEGGSEESGGYFEALGYVETPLGRRASIDWLASATLFGNEFPEDNDYGYRSLALGLEGRRDLDGWQMTLGLQPERAWLGGDPFLASLQLGLILGRPLERGRRVEIEMSETRFDSRSSEFDDLVGNRARIGVEWRAGAAVRRHRLRFRLEDNDRRNAADSDTSPRRQMIDWRVEQSLGGGRLLSGRIELRRSRYEEIAELRRTDYRWRLELGARQRLDGDWHIEETLQLSANDSNLDEEDYRKTLLYVSLQRFF